MTVRAFKVPPMSTIRLTKTKEMEKILNEIRRFYPLLDDAEIIKMIISRYYFDHHLPVRPATPEEEEAIAEARKDFEAGRYVVAPPDQPIDLDKIIDELKV